MDATIQIKITLDKGKELLLSHEDAKKLYEKLYEVYGEKEKITYVPYVPYSPSIVQPYNPWYSPDHLVTISCNNSSLE